MDKRIKTNGFYTQFALVPVDHQTSRQLLEIDLQGHISFNDCNLVSSVFKVDTVPETWLEAANEALDGIQDTFIKLSNARSKTAMYAPLVSVHPSSPSYKNELTFSARKCYRRRSYAQSSTPPPAMIQTSRASYVKVPTATFGTRTRRLGYVVNQISRSLTSRTMVSFGATVLLISRSSHKPRVNQPFTMTLRKSLRSYLRK